MTRTSSSRRRAKSNLIHKARWAGYATAAAATAVAGHEAADAAITFSGPQDIVVKAQPDTMLSVVSAIVPVDLDGNGTNDFAFVHVATGTSATSGFASVLQGGNGIAGFLVGSAPGLPYVSRLSQGQTVSSGTLTFLPSPPGYGLLASYSGYGNSQFLNPGEAFIGVRFDSMLGTHFGWIRVVMSGAPENSLTITNWAFGMPGEPIEVGQVPEAGSLGLLAFGAAGLLAWRRKRRHAALEKAAQTA